MNRILSIFVSLCFAGAAFAQTPDLISRTGLVGIWQNTPYVAAGWNDSHLFYADGRAVFAFNQMDVFKRLLRREGTWTLEGSTLTVTYTRELVIVGGKINKNAADGEDGIEGGKDTWRTLAKPIVARFNLSSIQGPRKNQYGDGAWSVLFDKKRFYKMNGDPKEYGD